MRRSSLSIRNVALRPFVLVIVIVLVLVIVIVIVLVLVIDGVSQKRPTI
jgi:hypothetical protein